MKSQIFRAEIPLSILFSFLEKYADDKGNYYLFSTVSYNKAKYHSQIASFCDGLKQYYHNAKHYYLDRKMNYNNFTTIIRQICKASLVTYTSKTDYNRSTYNIVYYIYKS